MKAEDLKNSILQLAIQGKLVPQDPNDEPAEMLLEKIRQEKEQLINNSFVIDKSKPTIIKLINETYYEFEGKKKNNITEEIPDFSIPNSWGWCRLTTANFIYTGNSINKSEKKSKYTGLNDGYSYIATKDVHSNHFIDYENGVKIPYEIEKFRKAKNQSILLCIEGGSAGRKIGILNQDVCFGNKLCCFDSVIIEPKFLYYYLQSPLFKETFYSKMTGIIGGVGIREIRKLIFPVPPLNEQQRIVEKIEEMLPHIEQYDKYEQQLTTLNNEFPEQIKKSILQEAIQGKLVPQNLNDEPAEILLEKIRQEKKQLIKDKKIKRDENETRIYKEDGHWFEIDENNEVKCIDEEIPFEIPETWTWCKLNNIAFITKLAGFEYTDKISPNILNKGVPLIKAKNLKDGILNLNFEGYISEELSKELIRSRINKKCILTPYVGASIGNVVLFNEKFIAHLAPNVGKIEVYGNKILEEYIIEFLRSSTGYKEITKYIKSTAQPSISMKALRDIYLPLPPFNEQQRIVEKIGELLLFVK